MPEPRTRSEIAQELRLRAKFSSNRAESLECDEIASLLEAVQQPQRPRIICLCGSTRFVETWIGMYQSLSDAGNIVLTVARMPPRPSLQIEQPELKIRLDELHKRKIDLADEVFVLNVGGYIGASTKSEIEYAITHGKPVLYLEPLAGSQPTEIGGATSPQAGSSNQRPNVGDGLSNAVLSGTAEHEGGDKR